MKKTHLFLIVTLVAASNLKIAAMKQEVIYPEIPSEIEEIMPPSAPSFRYLGTNNPQPPQNPGYVALKKKKSKKKISLKKLPKEKTKPDPVFLKNFYNESRHIETKKLCQEFDSKVEQVIHKLKGTHQTPVIVKDPIVKYNILLTIRRLEKSVRGLSRCSSFGRKKYFYNLANNLKLELLYLFAYLCTDEENNLLLARKHALNSKKTLTKVSRKMYLIKFKSHKYQVTTKFSPYNLFRPNETCETSPKVSNIKSHCKELIKLSKQFVDNLLETIEHAIEKKHSQHNIKPKKYIDFDMEKHIFQKFQKYKYDTDLELYFKALLGKKTIFFSHNGYNRNEISLPYLK